MSKHTPGPWEVIHKFSKGDIFIGPPLEARDQPGIPRPVLVVCAGRDEDVDMIARLIIDAPELFALVESADGADVLSRDWCERRDALLARIEGGEGDE